jgi:hypothetical protein
MEKSAARARTEERIIGAPASARLTWRRVILRSDMLLSQGAVRTERSGAAILPRWWRAHNGTLAVGRGKLADFRRFLMNAR